MISNAFSVVLRSRCPEFYQYNQKLPSYLKKGASRLENERITTYVSYSNFETISKTAGDALQQLAGRPCTALTAPFMNGDTTLNVESTLGFPSSASLFIHSQKVTYSSKTNTSFQGVSSSYTEKTYQAKQGVMLDVNSVINY